MKKSIATSKELKEISRLISSNDSPSQKLGISIAVDLGLKDIDIALLFLNHKIGWELIYEEFESFTCVDFSKTLLSNTFTMFYFFKEHCGGLIEFKTELNGIHLKSSIQLPNGIKRKSSPMGKLMHYLLKLIKRERLKLINK